MTIKGYDAFLECLSSEGVHYLFGNPGTTELAIMEALGKQSNIEYILGLQESIVVAMADGYARASGKLAVANVHVAPGLGNAMGSIYNAKFYGSPCTHYSRAAGTRTWPYRTNALRPPSTYCSTARKMGH